MAAHSDTPFKRLPVKIIGTGSYVPERRLTNADLEKMVDTSHEWIIERTGIVERRIAAPDEYTSHMGTKAAQRALESCGLKPEDIDLIIVATITPDTFTPSTSCYIQDALGAKNAAAFDISAACSALGAQIYDIVGAFYDVKVVFNYYHAVSGVNKPVEHIYQPVDIVGMKPGGRLVKYIDCPSGRSF